LSVGWDAQSTKGKDKAECKLILPHPLEAPDDRQGQAEDDKIHDDVEGLVDDEVCVAIDTLSIDRLIPVSTKGPTLKPAGDEDGGGPEADEPVYEVGDSVEARGRENATVEADDGDFDGGAESKVGELVCDEDLGRVSC
jgi:hypothetical protein